MKLFDKLKNIFIEEELVSEEEVPVISKTESIIEEKKVEEVKETPKQVNIDDLSDRSLIDTNQKFKFPVIFEDDDFKEEKRNTKTLNILEKETVKYEPKIEKDLRVQKKTFKPSPIISPVYGVLDKNYKKEEISSKDGLSNDYDSKIDIDSVMNKAYGTKKIEIVEEEQVECNNDEIDLFENIEESNEDSVKDIDDKIKSIDDLLKDTTDDDFYSLVDNMYKEEESNDENSEE